MDLRKIEILNFKGIKEAKIKLDHESIYPIVGINESGKTTLLEALNFLNCDDDFEKKWLDLVPSNMKYNFTGNISVKYFFQLNNSEINEVNADFIKANHMIAKSLKVFENLEYEIKIEIANSQFISETKLWRMPIEVLKNDESHKKMYTFLYELDNILWNKIVVHISKNLKHKILFLPSNIADIDGECFLDRNEYINSIKDLKMLEGINQLYKMSVNIDNNIWDDFEKIKHGNGASDIIDSKLIQMQKLLDKEFANEWNSLIGKKSKALIEFKFQYDFSSNKINVKVLEDNKSERLFQRSLGFRWLFSFVLITKFYKNENMIFILDEPAANLHSSAQKMLLNIFLEISKNNNKIIYSTHSPYLISPLYLENTYIIKNDNLKFEENEVEDLLKSSEASIKLTPYKQEVNSASSTTHYQTIIDALELTPSMINFNSSFNIILEGKNDQITLYYFLKVMNKKLDFNLIPCKNANSSSAVISLLEGLASNFCVLYDGDEEGKQHKKDNNEAFGFSKCYLLSDISKDFKHMESLIDKSDTAKLGLKTKKAINVYLHNCLLKSKFENIWSKKTISNFSKVFDFLSVKEGENSEK